MVLVNNPKETPRVGRQHLGKGNEVLTRGGYGVGITLRGEVMARVDELST